MLATCIKIGSEVDTTPISACLADSMHEPIGATNISQADDNEPFHEYNDDD